MVVPVGLGCLLRLKILSCGCAARVVVERPVIRYVPRHFLEVMSG
jgi:hypothetical protein